MRILCGYLRCNSQAVYLLNFVARPAASRGCVMPGRRRESHPPSPTDPDVNLSAHPARAAQLSGRVPQRPVREQVG